MDLLNQTLITEENQSRHESSIDSSFSINHDRDVKLQVSNNNLKTINVDEFDNYQNTKRPRYDDDEKIGPHLDMTVTSVENILKPVTINEVQNTVDNLDKKIIYKPKLTRSKAKELAKSMPDLQWHLTPNKIRVSPQMQALVDDDLLHEDSSDDEYIPHKDCRQPSEDDDDNVKLSLLESEPLAPVKIVDKNQSIDTIITHGFIHDNKDEDDDNDDDFKIPERLNFNVPTEKESIGHRTRSKLCLSETPIEQLEREFNPPDISSDMDHFSFLASDPNWGALVDEPILDDDDDENDPNYNFLEDNEIETVDKEELRSDRGVRIYKREVNLLYEEIGELMNLNENQQPKNKRSFDNSSLDSSLNDSTNKIICDSLQVKEESKLQNVLTEKQYLIISFQFEQHVQLMSQHFVMSYMHPVSEIHAQSIKCKNNLNNLKNMQDPDHPLFNISNLPDALKLVEDWEKKLADKQFCNNYIRQLEMDIEYEKKLDIRKHKYSANFNPELFELLMHSKALMYPQLLPHTPFRVVTLYKTVNTYCKSEENLLAIGLEKYLPQIKSMERKFHTKKYNLYDAVCHVSKDLMPTRRPEPLMNLIKKLQRQVQPDNPVQFYFNNGYAPKVTHKVPLDRKKISPNDRKIWLLPKTWQSYINENKNNISFKVNDDPVKNASTLVNDLSTSSYNMVIDENLLNPIIYVMPSTTSSRDIPIKIEIKTENNGSETSSTSKEINVPQLRQTTPRLAKIRSVQNMKLMTQVSSSSGKTKIKTDSSKNSDVSCGGSSSTKSSKGDNEDEIAELMLASTTIKKNTALRKKVKEANACERMKNLLENDSDVKKNENRKKFAKSYMQKLHSTLELNNPEVLKTVMKYFLEYYDKIELVQNNCEDEYDKLAIKLYRDVTNALVTYPTLSSEFLFFLTPQQAKIINKIEEHTMLMNMSEFISGSQAYFAKQPSRISKIIQALTQLTNEPSNTMENVISTMEPLLKGHDVIMDLFLKIFPNGKPPESLFVPSLFENLKFPVGPFDKNKVYTDDSSELYENIDLPSTNIEDNYGGDNCKCDCHENINTKSGNNDHCKSCGVRYLNGKVYLQTSEGLRPAKVTFEGDEEETIENIARVSVKTTENLQATTSGKRKKTSKNVATNDEQSNATSKISPIKDNDEIDKTTSKTKRGAKSPPKSIDQKKQSKLDTNINSVNSTNEITSPIKSKREKRAERREAKYELKNSATELPKINNVSSTVSSNSHVDSSNKLNQIEIINSDPVVENNNYEVVEKSEPMDVTETTNSPTISNEKSNSSSNKPWTRQEDMILLQNIQKDYSDSTFVLIAELLGDRTIDEVKKRFEVLLETLKTIV
ncbi:hypothetical protein HCN44_001706 [Aphidius gifuensis]|uniref:Myb-like domain-containing protein n=1 Tax=Aphidius gifuensis TaxID=684658 RepID=A0A834XT80_APHGI|nr:GON-4-like protein [Aphidius gifuensis]KAF7992381.1 hypothetical protein HCN44_001706 [Aphidius gifuensis]